MIKVRREIHRLRERWLRILYFGTPEIAEVGCALMAGAYGIGLLVPGNTFAHYPAFFRAMSRVAPEWVWGSVFLCAGIVRFLVAIDGEWKRRRTTALLMTCLWVGLAVMYMQGDLGAPFLKLLVAQALAGVWVYFRLDLRVRREYELDGNEGAPDGPATSY